MGSSSRKPVRLHDSQETVMDLVMVVPDGVGARNFLLGPFVRDAASLGPVRIIHAIPEELQRRFAAQTDADVEWHPIEPFGHGRLATTLRNALGYAHMYWARTQAMQRRLSMPVRAPSWRRRAMVHAARLLGRGAATPGGMATLAAWHDRLAAREPAVARYRALFRARRPSVVFATHQRPPEVIPAVLAARELGIPTATFIFSWDNLSTKGRIAAPFDHYLVWSEHMRAELLRYYPDVPPERTHVVGTPQFDPYMDPALRWSREEFFRHLGADPGRPLICYSGGDIGTCPEDAAHLRVLMEQIQSGRIRGNPQVVLRPSPVDPGTRYEPVRRDHPELLYAPPAWVHPSRADWSRVMPLPEDRELLVNLIYHSDLNINNASTMTLDFAIHDRPVVNLAFDVADPPPLGLPVAEVYYRYEHYQPVLTLGAARVARSADDLADHVNAYLRDPALDRENRRRLVALEIAPPVGRSGERVLEALRDIAGGIRPRAKIGAAAALAGAR